MKSSILIIAALLLTFTGAQKKQINLEVGAVVWLKISQGFPVLRLR
jgi:hypothetical protein